MKHRGLIFCGDLVPGVMAGTVTVTSRVIKPQPDGMCQDEPYWHVGGYRLRESALNPLPCRFRVGEKRYVKETWGAPYSDHPRCPDGKKPAPGEKIVYRAEGADDYQWSGCSGFAWRSPLFMPKWAARSWIEITGVKPARCQDITEEEVIASGCRPFDREMLSAAPTGIGHYMILWDELNARRGFPWSGNAHVWRLTFKLCEAPKKTEMTSEKV